jgi:hypothetical protein
MDFLFLKYLFLPLKACRIVSRIVQCFLKIFYAAWVLLVLFKIFRFLGVLWFVHVRTFSETW